MTQKSIAPAHKLAVRRFCFLVAVASLTMAPLWLQA
jgi:hypothetical protein